MKGPINIKNNCNKCFLWCHIRHLNLLKIHPEIITKEDKNMVNDLDYESIKFPVSKKDLARLKKYISALIWSIFLCMKSKKDCMDSLLITDGSK